MVQSFVVDSVEHAVPEPTGADLVCYQADQWSRGHTRFANKGGKKKSLSYTNHNKEQNQIRAHCMKQVRVAAMSNSLMNSTSNQDKETPAPSTSL